jgi:microcystin-dependent protein
MAVLQTGQSFASGDQVTATKLQDIANLATFRTGANQTADGSTIEVDVTGGYLKVPSNGIGSNQLSSDASVDANRAVDTNHIKDGAVTAAKLDSAATSVLMPTGSIMSFAGTSAPTGYLLCDGAAISRTTYSDLFGILGLTYGVGDGSTTFNIPDLRGRVIAGLDSDTGGFADRLTTASEANLDGRTLGANNGNPGDTGRGTNGAQEHQLTTAEMPSHSHTIPIQSSAGGNTPRDGGTGTSVQTRSTGTTGSDQAHNNVQPTIILNYIIKT